MIYSGNGFDGEWLRQARLKAGLHQHQVAAKLDCNQGRISEWETGQKKIPAVVVAQLKMILQ